MDQYEKYEKVISQYYKFKPNKTLQNIAGYDVFILLEKDELVGNVQFRRSRAYSIKNRKEYPFLSFFCFTITNNYNGKGLSYRLFEESIEYMKKRFKLPPETIVSLHLSPADQKMPIASSIYYNYGFKKGMYIRYDPEEMSHRIDKLFDESKDLIDIARGKEEGNGKGYFLMCYCFLKDIKRNKGAKKFGIEDGKALFNLLTERRNKSIDPIL